MLFDSYLYVIFLALVLPLFHAAPQRFRYAVLLGASYVFYMAWEPAYAILIAASTILDYSVGLLMGSTTSSWKRRAFLLASLGGNLGLLFAFKYLNFFSGVLSHVFDVAGLRVDLPVLDVLLPVGISFYTFQTLSYTIEVYRRKQEPERHLGYFALYVSFFPQLVAGPIERSGRLLPQLRAPYVFSYSDSVTGLRFILWGLFKKMVVADRLASFVEPVYASPEDFPGPLLTMATLAFAFQIYCDFSGYSDIAIGSARLLGIRLMTNFDRPYLATSIRDFWQRWHISLSTWFRDYVYIPLGGRRKSVPIWCGNLLIVFVLSGLWHGASWTFLAWGLVHGLVYVAWAMTQGVRASVESALGLGRVPRARVFMHWALTFLVVNVAWIFFRASNMHDAVYVLLHLGEGWGTVLQPHGLALISRYVQISPMMLMAMVCSVGFLAGVELVQRGAALSEFFDSLPAWVLWSAYVGLPLAILNFGVTDEVPFVYFQF